jgi:hypothetical protein
MKTASISELKARLSAYLDFASASREPPTPAGCSRKTPTWSSGGAQARRFGENTLRPLRLDPLRAADALQLAAVIEWAGGSSHGEFVAFDDRQSPCPE